MHVPLVEPMSELDTLDDSPQITNMDQCLEKCVEATELVFSRSFTIVMEGRASMTSFP